jgi:hypothetical protein
MDLVHRRLLLVKAALDVEDFTGEASSDFFLSRSLGLSRRQDRRFLGLLCESFLGTGPDNRHGGGGGVLRPGDFTLLLDVRREPGGEIFGPRITCSDTTLSGSGIDPETIVQIIGGI